MTARTVRDFWQRARQDPGFRAKLRELRDDGKVAAVAAVVRAAAESGSALTARQYEAALKEELARREAAVGEGE
jgi:hypothetical protein